MAKNENNTNKANELLERYEKLKARMENLKTKIEEKKKNADASRG